MKWHPQSMEALVLIKNLCKMNIKDRREEDIKDIKERNPEPQMKPADTTKKPTAFNKEGLKQPAPKDQVNLGVGNPLLDPLPPLSKLWKLT